MGVFAVDIIGNHLCRLLKQVRVLGTVAIVDVALQAYALPLKLGLINAGRALLAPIIAIVAAAATAKGAARAGRHVVASAGR